MSEDGVQQVEPIFDLKKELPGPADEAERQLIVSLDQLAQKVETLVSAGHAFPEQEIHHIFALKETVAGSPQATMILSMVLMKLGESNVQCDVLGAAVEKHGPLPPFLFYRSLAMARLGRLKEAVEQLQMVIAAGVKHYDLFMLGAKWNFELEEYRSAISMTNLAVYENVTERTEPFVFMASCFEKIGELEKMLECFARVEMIVGPKDMKVDLGELYERHGEMFIRVRGLRDEK